MIIQGTAGHCKNGKQDPLVLRPRHNAPCYELPQIGLVLGYVTAFTSLSSPFGFLQVQVHVSQMQADNDLQDRVMAKPMSLSPAVISRIML
jgi:hypothetical protein